MWHIEFIGLFGVLSNTMTTLVEEVGEVVMSNMDEWLNEMIDKGLASTSSSWIERAVEQKNDRMTVDLASSVLLTYDDWDKILLQAQTFN